MTLSSLLTFKMLEEYTNLMWIYKSQDMILVPRYSWGSFGFIKKRMLIAYKHMLLTDHLTNACFWTWQRSKERSWRVQNSPHHSWKQKKKKTQTQTHVLLNTKSEAPQFYESVFTLSNTTYCLLKQKSAFIHVKPKSNKKTQFISSRLKLERLFLILNNSLEDPIVHHLMNSILEGLSATETLNEDFNSSKITMYWLSTSNPSANI